MKLLRIGLLAISVATGVATTALFGSKAEAFQIYTLSSTQFGGANPTRFGVVDSDTGVYTDIANLGVAAHRNLVAAGNSSFYTTRRSGVNTELGLISTSGVFSPIGAPNNIQRTIFGMGMSPTGRLFGLDFNASPNILGNINPSSGAWSAIGSTNFTQVNNNTNSQGGKAAFHNGSLYLAGRTITPVTTRFGTLDQATGALTTISTSNPLMQYMVLTSYEGVLYGLYANGSTATPTVLPGLYTIDVATGASTRIRDITGFGSLNYLHGASAVPAPLPMLGAAAVFGSVRKLKGFSKRLASLKGVG